MSKGTRIETGDLFAFFGGESGNEQADIAKAAQRGAKAVLCQQRLRAGLPRCVVPNTREAYGRLCQALAGNPSQRLRVIGVTGTVIDHRPFAEA